MNTNILVRHRAKVGLSETLTKNFKRSAHVAPHSKKSPFASQYLSYLLELIVVGSDTLGARGREAAIVC